MTAPVEIPAGLFSMSHGEGHTCGQIGNSVLADGKCVTCDKCTPYRMRTKVHAPDGTTHLVLRCSHCDGPDAHHTLKKAAA